ncbi:transposase (fragment) [Methylocella tundrae]|uniref:Transposase n=1 Tax=Methylocella tundrae TaxID=227605 RepID=A0A4U8YZ36_METTU
MARRCKGSDALEYRNAAHLVRRANRHALFDKIRELYNAGKTVSAIAREVGFGRKSVDRWVRLLILPARNSMMRKTQSTPAYHEAFLLRRWAEGMTNGRRLFAEMLQRGYAGSYSRVGRLLAPGRAVAIPPKLRKSGPPLCLHAAKIPVPVLERGAF